MERCDDILKGAFWEWLIELILNKTNSNIFTENEYLYPVLPSETKFWVLNRHTPIFLKIKINSQLTVI